MQVIAPKGSKNIYRVCSDSKEQVTVLACASADGNFQNPLVVFPGKRTPKFNFGNVDPNGYSLGHSANGWMTSDTFFTWISSIFYPAVKDKIQFPILIFLDGHTSHINLAVADFCREHEIIIFCFPPHASHVLQPLDVSVFGPLKKKWNKSIQDFRLLHKMSITRSHFFGIFDEPWQATIANKHNVVSGFRSCGLVPFNADAVNYGKLIDKNILRNYEYQRENSTAGSHTAIYERLGAVKLMQLFETKLTNEMKESFEKRLEEEYDIEDMTPKGILWSFYKDAKIYIKNFESVNAVDSTINRVSEVPHTPLIQVAECNPNETELPNERIIILNDDDFEFTVTQLPSNSSDLNHVEINTISSAQEIDIACPPHVTNLELIPEAGPSHYSDNEPIPEVELSTHSSSPSSSYDQFKFSPFRKYLTISDKLPSGRKTSLKQKTPPSFTGNDYYENLKRIQEEKQKLQEEKEKRKRDREQRKLQSEKKKSSGVNRKGRKRLFEVTELI